MNCDLAARRETVISAVRVADQSRIVGIVANTAAGHGVGVAIYNADR